MRPLDLLARWAEMGLDPSQFWDLTFREIAAIMSGARRRIRREHDGRAWAAWHIGQLTAIAANAPKKYPKLADMLSGASERPKEAPRQIDHERVRGFFIGLAKRSEV